MPDIWDAGLYRQRAAAWRDRALARDADAAGREVCIRIARDYEILAQTLDEIERLASGAADDAEAGDATQ
jgi:hypothetical protein